MLVTGAASGLEEELMEFVEGRGAGSRLSCQIKITPALDGLTVRVPRSTLLA